MAGAFVAVALVLSHAACRNESAARERLTCDCGHQGSGSELGGRAGSPASGGLGSSPAGGATPSSGGSASDGASGEAGSGGSDGPPPPDSAEVVCRSLGADEGCRVEGSGDELVVRGDVLGSRFFVGGEVRVRADGTIGCVGCDCSEGPEARRVTCPGAVVSPAFVNPHDHIAYAHEPPRPASAERYDHRHDWRLGLRGHTAIDYEGGASAAARAAHELRMLLDGATAIAGGAGQRGLLRNLDVPGLEEGVLVAPAGSDTFPLDDADGLFVRSGCAYGAGRTTRAETERWGAYLPHLGEGVDAEAANELSCALEPPLVGPTTAVVHAIAVDATLARALSARRALVVWSPRSNLSLYGNTAPVGLLRRSGVELALGTDWLLSGSMNVRRELECARSFSQRFLDGELDAPALFAMATASAARAAGAGSALGRVEPGYFADLQVVRRRALEPHAAVVLAAPGDVLLVLRAGVPLYGDRETLDAFGGDGCEPLDVCGVPKRVCLAETGRTLAELVAASPYPLVACEPPPNEPSCVPARPGEYDGVASDDDADADGVPNERDGCPRVFDPVRPLDMGQQPDADRDDAGDACDPCPLDPDRDCRSRLSNDFDGDGVENATDDCPRDSDPAQDDRDHDDIGDACDFCASANPGVSPCPLAVAALRDPAHTEHPPRHALVLVDEAGVVALRPDAGSSRGYYVGQEAQPFSGIFVFTGSLPPGVSLGERVTLRARLDAYQGTGELVAATVLARTPGDTGEPLLVEAASIGDGGELSEHYESMLVRVEGVTVANSNPDAPSDYDELLLEGGLRVDDLLDPALDNDLAEGTRLRSVTGILGYSFGHWKLWPRGPGDWIRD